MGQQRRVRPYNAVVPDCNEVRIHSIHPSIHTGVGPDRGPALAVLIVAELVGIHRRWRRATENTAYQATEVTNHEDALVEALETRTGTCISPPLRGVTSHGIGTAMTPFRDLR